MDRILRTGYRMIIIGILALFCVTCQSAPTEKELTFSGFLGNYSGFRPSPDESGSWSYEKPGVNLAPYRALMMDPLVVWNNPDPKDGGLNSVDLWQLQLTFRDRVVSALGNDYAVVERPGPHVLRLRAALTDARESRPESKLNTPGSVVPLTKELLIIATETLGSTNFIVGQAALEAELLDSQTSERLIGYIEKRKSSASYVSENPHDLSPIVEIFDFWAIKLRNRLDRTRKQGEIRRGNWLTSPLGAF